MTAAGVPSIGVDELARRLASDPDQAPVVLDVREDWERQLAAVDFSVNMPMNGIPDRLDELQELQGERDLVVMCHSGHRSQMIAKFLTQSGIRRVLNLTGGIAAWSEQIDPTVHQY